MKSEKKKSLPWLIPGIRLPNFYFPSIRLNLSITIPSILFFALAQFLVFYIFSGSVYNSVVENVLPYRVRPDGTIQLINWDQGDVSHQYELEGYIAAIIIYIGVLGLFLVKKASEEPHNINRAIMYQFLGFILIFIAFLIIQNMFNYKSSKKPPY